LLSQAVNFSPLSLFCTSHISIRYRYFPHGCLFSILPHCCLSSR